MAKKKRVLNAFGEYLEKRSVNKAQVCKRTGIHPTRMTWLCYAPVLYVRSSELQLIALAINEEACKIHKDLFGDLALKEEFTPSEKLINNISKKLNDQGLIKKYEIGLQDIARISEILPFCVDEKTESQILDLLNLKRKSSKFSTILKVCLEINWLVLHQKNMEGNIVKTYLLGAEGKKVI